MTSEELEALEKLLAKSVPGPLRICDPYEYPWRMDEYGPQGVGTVTVVSPQGYGVLSIPQEPADTNPFNLQSMVAARNAAPALIAAARENARLRAVVEAARAMHDAGVDPRNGPAGKALAELALALSALDAKGVE
jgi:hypothetical protein